MTSFIIYALKQIWGYLCDKINVGEIGVTCDTYGNDENRLQFLAWQHEGRRQLGSPKRSLENSTKMDLKEISVHWLHMAEDRAHLRPLVNTAMNFCGFIEYDNFFF